jgi:hypothetical protein
MTKCEFRPQVPLFLSDCLTRVVQELVRCQSESMYLYALALKDPMSGEPVSDSWSLFEHISNGSPDNGSETLMSLLSEEQLLSAFVQQANLFGWTSLACFERVRFTLMCVLEAPLKAISKHEGMSDFPIKFGLALRGLVTQCLLATARPVPGHRLAPLRHIPRMAERSFLHTRLGLRLAKSHNLLFQHPKEITPNKLSLTYNIDRRMTDTKYEFGQLSVAFLRSNEPVVRSRKQKSLDAMSPQVQRRDHHQLSADHSILDISWITPNVEQTILTIKDSIKAVLVASNAPHSRILTDILKALLVLSDLNSSKEFLAWVLETATSLSSKISLECELSTQLLLKCMCKCISILQSASVPEPSLSLTQKLMEICMHSRMANSWRALLQSYLMLLDGRVSDMVLPSLASTCTFVLSCIRSARDETLALVSYAVGFSVIEHYHTEAQQLQFTQQVRHLYVCCLCKRLMTCRVFHVRVVCGILYPYSPCVIQQLHF